jgi:hypothetical protein
VPTLARVYEDRAADYTRAAEQTDDPVFRNLERRCGRNRKRSMTRAGGSCSGCRSQISKWPADGSL